MAQTIKKIECNMLVMNGYEVAEKEYIFTDSPSFKTYFINGQIFYSYELANQYTTHLRQETDQENQNQIHSQTKQ